MIKNIPVNLLRYNLDIDVKEIHKTVIKILEELGITIESKKALEILKSLGADVDFKNYNAKIPETLISNSLKGIKPEYDIYNREGNYQATYGGNNILLTSGAAAIRIKEFNGSYRGATLDDLKKFTILHDYYNAIDIVHTSADATDAKQQDMRVMMAATVFKNTSKSAWFVASRKDAVECIYNLALAIRGSKSDLDSKPFFRIGASPEAVLGFQKDEIELMIRCAELGIPTGCEAYPIMGLTAPLSVSGALALTAANYLAAHVIKTSIDPDNQNVFPVMSGSFNMKNGEIVTSAPEIWQYYVTGIKLANFYGIPAFVLVASDSKELDIQAIYEKTSAFLIVASSGANNIFAATNDLDAMNLATYENVVVELEILSSFAKFFRNIPILGHKKDFELIKNGLKNKMFFLEDPYTLSNFKDFLWNTDIFIKDNYLNWKKNGMVKIVGTAHQKVKEILLKHKPLKLPEKTIAEIEKIISSFIKNHSNNQS